MTDMDNIPPPKPVIWPVPLVVLWLGAGVLINWALPAHLPLPGAGLLGAAFYLAGFWFAIWALWVFHQAQTTVNPAGKATHLITNGPFAYSRNPIYVAMVVGGFGVGLALANLWIIIGTIPVFAILDRGVIAGEERYATQKFGQQYADYCARVPRWLGKGGLGKGGLGKV